MRPLLKTLALIAFVVLVAQTIRHGYMLWFEPRGSVLDKYDQPMKGEINAAASLDELLRRYDQVRKEVDVAKQDLAKTGEKPPAEWEQNQKEPFKSEQMLRQAINEWEGKSKEIHTIRVYCVVALALLILGSLTYVKWNRWFGVALWIAAFSEFVYWTSPTFLGATREFDRLLVNKLALSIVSLVLLIAIISFFRIFDDKDANSA